MAGTNFSKYMLDLVKTGEEVDCFAWDNEGVMTYEVEVNFGRSVYSGTGRSLYDAVKMTWDKAKNAGMI